MKTLIKVENLNYTIPYGKMILEDLNFELKEGEFLGVLGRNGVGKTTLIDLLLGLRPVISGSVKILDETPEALIRNRLNEICFLSQDNTLKGSLSIKQFLSFYSTFYPKYSKDVEKELLIFFNLKEEYKIGSLSTGQQKKVQIISAFSSQPQILIIDEITAVLDPETRSQFFSVVQKYREESKLAIILATNIAEDLIARADKILFIDQGKASIKRPDEILNLFNIEKIA